MLTYTSLVTFPGYFYVYTPNHAAMVRNESVSRRTALKIAGAAASTALVAGCTGNGDDDDGNGDDDDGPVEIDPGEMVFEGRTAGWELVEPVAADESNPTIVLQEGETYTFTWTNEDGGRHNIELWDDNDEVVEDYQTEVIDEQGAEQSLEFEAVSEITQYVCEPHTGTMIGEVVVE